MDKRTGGTHYRQDETLVKNVNRNGTIDFGKFQINSAWEAKAASMGYNTYLPEGNEAFAYWLYETEERKIGTAQNIVGLNDGIHEPSRSSPSGCLPLTF